MLIAQSFFYDQKLSLTGGKKFQETKNVFVDQYPGINGGNCLLPDDLPVYHE